MSAALDFHRATNVPARGTDEDEARTVDDFPRLFKRYEGGERVPVEHSPASRLLADGARVIRSRESPIGTIYFRAYSSAGALYPVEAYVAARDGLYSFDPLEPALVRVRAGDARVAVAEAAVAEADEFVVLTGLHWRTGWKYQERGYRHIWWDAGTMLANLLALAAADDLKPRLFAAFVDRELDHVLGIDGEKELSLAVLALGGESSAPGSPLSDAAPAEEGDDRPFPGAATLHAASSFGGADEVRAWRSKPDGDEPRFGREELVRAMRRRASVRKYSREPLPADELASLLDWAEAPIPADAPRVGSELVTVAAVDGLEPGVYDAQLSLIQARNEADLREAVGFAAMEQDHPRDAAVNVFQLADVGAVVERLGDRGYRWAQLEAGIRAGRVQIGAFARGWGAAASTFFDDEVSRELSTSDSPMLMVAVGTR